jgi:hypothetical protein
MKRFWAALVLSILLTSVHLAGEAEFRSAILSPIIDAMAIAAFPGTAVVEVLAFIGKRPWLGSLPVVCLVSILINFAFYWVVFSVGALIIVRSRWRRDGKNLTT